MSKHLLIAEDDADLGRLIGLSVRVLWPDCTIAMAGDGVTALRHAADRRPDLAILDVMIPPPDGFVVCSRLRRDYPQLPILMLTARDTTLDEVRGLDSGADSYLVKPFDHSKLLAHLRALLRRSEAPTLPVGDASNDRAPRADPLTFDFETHEVRVGDAIIDLTPTEYLLLEMLARHAGETVSHRALLEQVWGRDYVNDTHYLKVFVNRLRQKLGDDATRPRFIETQRSTGYRLVATPHGADHADASSPTVKPLDAIRQ